MEPAGSDKQEFPKDAGAASSETSLGSTPRSWRIAILAAILLIGLVAYFARSAIGPRGQAVAGVFCFFGLVAMFSTNLRAVNWRTIGWGLALQLMLALLVLKVPAVNALFNEGKKVVVKFIDFSDKG